jgi:hypothetical protein
MIEVEEGAGVELTAEMIRAQLDLMVRDEVFRSSKRSVAFLKYVVEQTLNGAADQIKERTIGAEVFGRKPSYDTNLDHIVRTAATELRKRLAIYYGGEKHRSELRIGLVPGSYIPRFTLPTHTTDAAAEPAIAELAIEPLPAPPTHVELSPDPLIGNEVATSVPAHRRAIPHWVYIVSAVAFVAACLVGYRSLHRGSSGGSWRCTERPPDTAGSGRRGRFLHPDSPPRLISDRAFS